MKIFENYNTAKQKYGEELANSVLSNGIPNEYVYTACRYYTEDNIPIEVLQQKFRQWMSYVRNLGKDIGISENCRGEVTVLKTLNEC